MTTATMELYNALLSAGVDKEHAEAAARAVISRDETEGFATKEDIADVRSDISSLRAEMYKTNKQTVMWMAGFHLASFGALVTIIQLMINGIGV